MKKAFCLIAITCLLLVSGCSNGNDNTTKEFKKYTAKANGYGGELEVEVLSDGTEIKEINLISNHESAVVISPAFPLLQERIISAQSPIVDSVSGATFSSFAIKSAVADAMKQSGKDFGAIAMNTSAPAKDPVTLEDVKTQLVIVGGGPAGLAAAITAKENGINDVIVIEKLDILSGNGKFDMNFYDVFNSEAQKANGIEDSVDKFIEDQKNAGNTPERLAVWAEGESVIDAWLRSMGVELNYNYGGRNHMVDKDTYAGEAIQIGMEAKVKDLGVDVRSGTKGLDFIFDGDKVVGVSVQHGHESYNIMADAVIVATGGFSANKALLAKYAPGHETLNTSNQMGATGDFVEVFEKYDFKLEKMDSIRVYPLILRLTRDLTNNGAGSVFVNTDAKRFTNERLGNLQMGNDILAQKNGTSWMVVDQKKVEDNANVRKQVSLNKFLKADTIAELAELMGVDSATLVATIDEYNLNATNKVEDEFNQTPERALSATGPYYAAQVEGAIHMTKGGVAANEHAQILKNDGSVVEGLYGAGEVTFQSGGYSQSVVFGRIAAVEAAQYITSK